MLLINNQVVAQILDMKSCIEALDIGYRDLVNERAYYRGRYDFFVPSDDPKLMYRWGTMEGASRSFETFAIQNEVRHARVARRQDRGKILRRARHLLWLCHGFLHPQRRAAGDHQRRHHPTYARRRLRRSRRKISFPRRLEHGRHLRLGRHGTHLPARVQRSPQAQKSKSLQSDKKESRDLRRRDEQEIGDRNYSRWSSPKKFCAARISSPPAPIRSRYLSAIPT